jgi:hypothetical protein
MNTVVSLFQNPHIKNTGHLELATLSTASYSSRKRDFSTGINT